MKSAYKSDWILPNLGPIRRVQSELYSVFRMAFETTFCRSLGNFWFQPIIDPTAERISKSSKLLLAAMYRFSTKEAFFQKGGAVRPVHHIEKGRCFSEVLLSEAKRGCQFGKVFKEVLTKEATLRALMLTISGKPNRFQDMKSSVTKVFGRWKSLWSFVRSISSKLLGIKVNWET